MDSIRFNEYDEENDCFYYINENTEERDYE